MNRHSLLALVVLLLVAGVWRYTPVGTASASPAKPRAAAVLALPAELPSATGYSFVDAIPAMKFENPICMACPPGETGRIFVVERAGKIQAVTGYGTRPEKHEFLDIAAVARSHGQTLLLDGEMGAWGLAFHPQYKTNGYFYVTYGFSAQDGGKTQMFDRLSRFTVSKTDPNAADPQSEQPILTQVDLATNHNGGDIHFANDGYLYWCNGDEGGGGDNFHNSRFIDKDFFAGIFRLDVDKRPGNLKPNPHAQASILFPSAIGAGTYLVPADNPFVRVRHHNGKPVDINKIRTEIWCTGLRNPWRFSFDPADGQMFIGNVGEGMWEQIDIGVPGGDYGWNYFEGSHPTRDLPDKPPAAGPFITPICEYSHQPGGHGEASGGLQGNCVTGGIVYRGSQLTELFGTYIFSDWGNRRVWGLKREGNQWMPRTLVDRDDDFVSFAADPQNGDVLGVSLGGNKIRRLVRRGTTGAEPPKLLSETGAFAALKSLAPAAGLMAYTPNAQFWSDYAVKSRWVTVPANQAITFSRDGNWTFPTGTTWVKQFDMEMTRGVAGTKRHLETRFLVKTTDGVYGVSYKWRDDQSDADLVDEAGANVDLAIRVDGEMKTQTWHYPSRNECNGCHTAVAGYALGFDTPQLNGPVAAGHPVNIQVLSDVGYFTKPVISTVGLPALVNPADASKPLNDRVRSYLAANCVQCHQPGGGATGLWDARFATPFSKTNILNGPLQNTLGDPKNRFVAPGDPAHSVLLRRLTADNAPRMPPIASNELDTADITLITAWIKTLPK